jgi:2-polyprenyl-6-methoxyphenol hydroxylase-like FAD-dependent oxidoreductase
MGPKIMIIGGGIGGLTAAVALARQGVAVEVYEQAPVLEEVGAGVGLWPNAMTALERIGLSGKVARLAVTVTRQGLRRSDGTWLMCIPEGVMARRWGAEFILVHRAELQQLLAAELDQAAIHLGARCTGLEDTGRAVTAHFADGREVQADVLVGADGVHSAVRAALFGPAPLRYRGYVTVRGITAAGSVPLPRDGTETWGRGARFGLGPSSGDRIIWYATWNTAAGSKDDGDTTARLRELFGTWHDPIPAIIDATPKTALIRNDIYDRRPARTWSRGRVTLLGDAIHPMTPDLAQGACQAIVDATTLATCLAAARDPRVALRDYEQRRWRNAAITVLMARNMGIMGQWEGRVTCTARNALTRALPLPLQLRQFDLVLGAPGRPAGSARISRPRTRQPIPDRPGEPGPDGEPARYPGPLPSGGVRQKEPRQTG